LNKWYHGSLSLIQLVKFFSPCLQYIVLKQIPGEGSHPSWYTYFINIINHPAQLMIEKYLESSFILITFCDSLILILWFSHSHSVILSFSFFNFHSSFPFFNSYSSILNLVSPYRVNMNIFSIKMLSCIQLPIFYTLTLKMHIQILF